MSDRAAFERAILDSPDDDLPRLVFADWLDEHGEPDRAEFIRLECEKARLPSDDPRYSALEKRAWELLVPKKSQWTKEMRVPRGEGLSYWFHRGFLYGLLTNPADFVSNAQDIFTRAPIQSVEFRRYQEQGVIHPDEWTYLSSTMRRYSSTIRKLIFPRYTPELAQRVATDVDVLQNIQSIKFTCSHGQQEAEIAAIFNQVRFPNLTIIPGGGVDLHVPLP